MLAFKSKSTDYVLLEDYLGHSILGYLAIEHNINSALVIKEKNVKDCDLNFTFHNL